MDNHELTVKNSDEIDLSDSMNANISNPFGYFPDAELVFAIVCPLGANHQGAASTLANYLGQFGYQSNQIRLSEEFQNLCQRMQIPYDLPVSKFEQAKYKMKIGNQIRELTGQLNIFGQIAAGRIAEKRQETIGNGDLEHESNRFKVADKLPHTAHIITTLKRPEEVDVLRRIYGTGFFLIGLMPLAVEQSNYFEERGMGEGAAELMDVDQAEDDRFGQRTRDTFQLADVFVPMGDYQNHLSRFLELIFGNPLITPELDEHAMFLAYAASLRSGDLSRQVGAAIFDQHGDSIAVGCNEVPRFGGGIYGPGIGSHRDMENGSDSNDKAKKEMIESVLKTLGKEDMEYDEAKKLLKKTGLPDLTEFGRSVHAEMEALLACARTGRSTRGATLYTTTFPCHNCCRHIIGAGIARVLYIEPYPKSKAFELHKDAISTMSEGEENRIPFTPFIGVGPRRYFDLFSLKLSTGLQVDRKRDGHPIVFERSNATPRLQMQPNSYLEREFHVWSDLSRILASKGSNG